jgi:hypothetical protein
MSRNTATVDALTTESSVDEEAAVGLNLAIVWGPCSGAVEVRTLDSGTRVASLAVRTPPTPSRGRRRATSTTATSVPVTVWDPPTWVDTLEAGDVVVVVGTVRRRFFATRGGGRGARSEVEAISIARATPRQLEHAWQRATSALDALV